MTELLQASVDFIWGIPLLIFIFSANLILVFYSKFLPLGGFKHAISLLAEKKENSPEAKGQISHFQSFCNAIAATVGLGNISGVAIAISTGGPGALFWMWIAAIFGMNTKFFECTVAQIFRGQDYKGEVQGGAMYVIEQALPKKFKPLSVMFAICGLIGTLSLFQINQLAEYGQRYYEIKPILSGLLFSVLTGWILTGGLKSISKVCSLIVPIMSLLYFMVGVLVIVMNNEKLLPVIQLIFKEALSPSSAFGGIVGYGFVQIMTTGLKRATFSNEAGIGTAPMAHSNSKTSQPVSEGYVAMLGPFLDTIIVCSITGFIILLSFPEGIPQGISGIELTTIAFTKNLGVWGQHFLGITVVLFAFSTMIGMANYNQKCWDYLFRGKWIFKDKLFLILYSGSILLGAVIPMLNVINLMDIAYALMTIPNVFATIYLAKKVRDELLHYNKKLKLNDHDKNKRT
jgi:AGCS family alanine or glycine:cation symporter